ncbi:uncharacterized protein LOC135368347 [Ornithodoros turicata]|uniref:uncharacterized protein LOC135368347 n=1 Tax=Ornithodoros turicata TaxID=34597 RepID=UPI0031393B58
MPDSRRRLVPTPSEQFEVRNPARQIPYTALLTIAVLWGTVIFAPVAYFWLGLYLHGATDEPREVTTADIWSVYMGIENTEASHPSDSGGITQAVNKTSSIGTNTKASSQPSSPSTESPTQSRRFSAKLKATPARTIPPTVRVRTVPGTTPTSTSRRRIRTLSSKHATIRTFRTRRTVHTSTGRRRRSTRSTRSTTPSIEELPTYTGDFDIEEPDFMVRSYPIPVKQAGVIFSTVTSLLRLQLNNST